MCLEQVDLVPGRKWGTGYKSVKKNEDGSYTCYDNMKRAGSVAYPLNKWLKDPQPNPDNEDPDKGFHIMLELQKAEDINNKFRGEVVIKVRFRKVIATDLSGGSLTYGKVVVAREIMNLGEV